MSKDSKTHVRYPISFQEIRGVIQGMSGGIPVFDRFLMLAIERNKHPNDNANTQEYSFLKHSIYNDLLRYCRETGDINEKESDREKRIPKDLVWIVECFSRIDYIVSTYKDLLTKNDIYRLMTQINPVLFENLLSAGTQLHDSKILKENKYDSFANARTIMKVELRSKLEKLFKDQNLPSEDKKDALDLLSVLAVEYTMQASEDLQKNYQNRARYYSRNVTSSDEEHRLACKRARENARVYTKAVTRRNSKYRDVIEGYRCALTTFYLAQSERANLTDSASQEDILAADAAIAKAEADCSVAKAKLMLKTSFSIRYLFNPGRLQKLLDICENLAMQDVQLKDVRSYSTSDNSRAGAVYRLPDPAELFSESHDSSYNLIVDVGSLPRRPTNYNPPQSGAQIVEISKQEYLGYAAQREAERRMRSSDNPDGGPCKK